jgi:hypothetical protein
MGGKQPNKQGKAAKSTPALKRVPQSSPPGGLPRLRGATGERDETYDLVSVLYHALQGAETCGTYLRDAEAAGDDDLAEFFEDTRAEYVARAAQAKQLLASRLEDQDDDDEEDEELLDEDDEEDDEEDEEDEE